MKRILLVIVCAGVSIVLLVAIAGMYKFNYLASQPGYDVDGNKIAPADRFEVIEVLNQSCQIDNDCETPTSYAIQSNCPYASVCLENTCTVVCPYPFSGKRLVIESPRSATYTVNNESITLVNGLSEKEAAPGSASKIATRYFGNEVRTDLNDDDREDVAFLLTQETGGTGTYFYVVAALTTEHGWVGSSAHFLGDRIAPQTTEVSQNPDHKNVIVVNYVDRENSQAMSGQPSIGKSVWLRFDPELMQFGEVEQSFSGEADPGLMTLDMQTWSWIKTRYHNDTELVPNRPDVFTLTFTSDGAVSATTDCNQMGGTYELDRDQITFSEMAMTAMYCPDSQEQEFAKMFEDTRSYYFTTKGELIFEFKFNGGTATFR